MDKQKKGVRLEHISKIYKDPKTGKDFYAVKDTTLDIEPGTFVTLLGPSGCGKTTTLRMIAGFESPDEGEIYLGDQAINALTPNKRDTAMVFQSYALLPHYNVFDNVAYPLKIQKVPKAQIKEKEGQRILAHIKDGTYVIALAIEGDMLDSVELSRKLARLGVEGKSQIAFVIGGSLGLSPEVMARADYALSFSRMTFPHQLMRVVLLEQIYRSYRISAGEPYHK